MATNHDEVDDHPGLDVLEEKIEEMHGHRMAISMQKARQLQPEEAIKAQAEADTYRRVLHAIAHVREGKGLPDETRESYVQFSRAMRSMETSVADRQDEPEQLRGLQ